MSSYHFLVNRSDLSETRIDAAEAPAAGPGETVIRVDRFALTANNITYGVAGDLIGYWKFFPAESGWGRIPVWGIGTVVESGHPSVPVGERLYGYFPMSGHLRVKPGRVSAAGFSDESEHRSGLPPVYNHYSRMTPELGFAPALDNHQLVYRPLFTTSFVIDDFFDDNEFFGARQVVIASASSKTAIGTAFMMKQRARRLVGLTSAGNASFVRGLGLYDQVLTYDEVSELDRAAPTAYVDMSGNRDLLNRIHHHFRQRLVYSCAVGITHHEDRPMQAPDSLPGARPTMFFAPSQIQKRNAEWGADGFRRRLGAATRSFLQSVDQWVRLVETAVPDELESTYRTVLGGAPPDRAFVCVQPDAASAEGA